MSDEVNKSNQTRSEKSETPIVLETKSGKPAQVPGGVTGKGLSHADKDLKR